MKTKESENQVSPSTRSLSALFRQISARQRISFFFLLCAAAAILTGAFTGQTALAFRDSPEDVAAVEKLRSLILTDCEGPLAHGISFAHVQKLLAKIPAPQLVELLQDPRAKAYDSDKFRL